MASGATRCCHNDCLRFQGLAKEESSRFRLQFCFIILSFSVEMPVLTAEKVLETQLKKDNKKDDDKWPR